MGNNMLDDLISRQAAIDAEGLDEQIRCEMCRNPMHTDRGCDGNCKYDEKLYERIMQILDERIKPLPSAQPEQRWIPCSERLPETYGAYLVQDVYGTIFVDYWRGYWVAKTTMVAWMPLPEPYREERTEE